MSCSYQGLSLYGGRRLRVDQEDLAAEDVQRHIQT